MDYFFERFLSLIPDSVEDISLRILGDGPDSWKIHLFDFVDRLRREHDAELIKNPPVKELDSRVQSLIASTVEALCHECDLSVPSWCRGIPSLAHPWFVSGIENLKAMSLVESPAEFRTRNIFVLDNFLSRV